MIDDIAAALGARDEARRKWRARGIPAEWRIHIAAELAARGVPFGVGDFDSFDELTAKDAA